MRSQRTKQIHWDFEIQADHLISARRPDLMLINKKKCHVADFAMLADKGVKIKESKADKY